MTKMTYGEHTIHGIAKLYVCPREKEGVINKALIAGVILTSESLTPTIENGYEVERMYECEVIIIPKKIFEKNIYTGGGASIEVVLVSGYGYRENYEREITIKK
jgi:hypothetical protein